MSRRFDVVVSEEWTTPQGEKKKSWKNIGVAFESDKGSILVKLHALPIGGTMNLFIQEPKERTGERRGAGEPQPSRNLFKSRVNQPPAQEAASSGGDDEIPF